MYSQLALRRKLAGNGDASASEPTHKTGWRGTDTLRAERSNPSVRAALQLLSGC